MQYLTHEEYSEYGSTIDANTFKKYELQARILIDGETQNRVKNEFESGIDYDENLKLTMISLIDNQLQINACLSGDNVKSASNNGISITYNNHTITELENKNHEIIITGLRGITNTHGIPLLFLGVDNF